MRERELSSQIFPITPDYTNEGERRKRGKERRKKEREIEFIWFFSRNKNCFSSAIINIKNRGLKILKHLIYLWIYFKGFILGDITLRIIKSFESLPSTRFVQKIGAMKEVREKEERKLLNHVNDNSVWFSFSLTKSITSFSSFLSFLLFLSLRFFWCP